MEELQNSTEIARNASELANNFYSDIRPIVQPVSKCIGAVLDFISTPVCFLSEKSKINFEKRLEEYKAKMAEVRDENKCEVHPEIGVPIMQVLHYTTNDEIADMFTNLLTTASVDTTAGNAYPAFIEYIKQMSPDEARIVNYLNHEEFIPHVSLRVHYKDSKEGFISPIENSVSIAAEVNLIYPQNVGVYISNLVSMVK